MCAVLHDDGQALANKFVGPLVVAGNDLFDIDSPFEAIPKHGGLAGDRCCRTSIAREAPYS